MAKRIRDLQVNEISAVDRGAGDGCRVLLMKRAGEAKGDDTMSVIEKIVDRLAVELRKSDKSLSPERAQAEAFASLPSELREIVKARQRGASAAELAALRGVMKANTPTTHREQPDAERSRRGFDDDEAHERDEAPMAKLTRKAAKLRKKNPSLYKTDQQAFAAVCDTPKGRELLAADKLARVGAGY